MPGETREQVERPDFAWPLLESWGLHPGNAEIERCVVHTFSSKIVPRWRRGRLLRSSVSGILLAS